MKTIDELDWCTIHPDVKFSSRVWGCSLNPRKLLTKALSSPANLRFEEVCAIARAFGFHLSRVSGSHHIFAHPEVAELVNLQEIDGKAKPYQVKQLLALVERYNLSLGKEE